VIEYPIFLHGLAQQWGGDATEMKFGTRLA